MVHNFDGNRHPPGQMFLHFRAQLRPVFLEQDVVRGVDGNGNLAPFGKEAHRNRPVDQFIGHDHFVLPLAVVALQELLPVFVCSNQPHNVPMPVQVHLNLRIDGQVDG